MFNFSPEEVAMFKKLNTPRKIQEFVNQIPINFEPTGDTCLSPRSVLKENRAHCIEGAMLAALALRFHGHRPLIVDLTSSPDDDDHVIAVFEQDGFWGAISKTNHAVLRYRDPIYQNIRELVMSFFHEYFDTKGRKTLRSYTEPIDLSLFDDKGWMEAEGNLWYVVDHIDSLPHIPILTRRHIALLKRPDPIEMKYGELVEWKPVENHLL